MKQKLNILTLCNATTRFDVIDLPYNIRNKGPYLFVELQIDLKFSGNNVMLPKYDMAVPCFADVQQTARNYVYFFKTLFIKMIFFGLLRVPMMTLPRQPVFWAFLVTFLSFLARLHKVHRAIVVTSVVRVYVYVYVCVRIALSVKVF